MQMTAAQEPKELYKVVTIAILQAAIFQHEPQVCNLYVFNCQARVQVPNPLSQQAPNPDPKVRPSIKNPKSQFFGLGLTQ